MARSASNIDYKVQQAEFFLRRLSEPNVGFFEAQCYADAFVAATRSVTFALQAVCSGIPGFSEWYYHQQSAMRADSLMRFFTTTGLRVLTWAIVPHGPVGAVATLRGIPAFFTISFRHRTSHRHQPEMLFPPVETIFAALFALSSIATGDSLTSSTTAGTSHRSISVLSASQSKMQRRRWVFREVGRLWERLPLNRFWSDGVCLFATIALAARYQICSMSTWERHSMDPKSPRPNEITGANAGGPPHLRNRARSGARIAQFCRWINGLMETRRPVR